MLSCVCFSSSSTYFPLFCPDNSMIPFSSFSLSLFIPSPSSNIPLLCRMLLNIFYRAFTVLHLPLDPLLAAPSRRSASLWSAHRMLSSISCHPGHRKEAKYNSIWCAISSNSLHLDCTVLCSTEAVLSAVPNFSSISQNTPAALLSSHTGCSDRGLSC